MKSIDTKPGKGDTAFRICMIVFFIGATATAILVAVWSSLRGVDSLLKGIDSARPWMAGWRLLLFAVLIGGWRFWTAWLVRWANLDAARHRFMLSQRWRVAA